MSPASFKLDSMYSFLFCKNFAIGLYANLITIIPNLQIKMGYDCVPDLTHLTELSHKVSGIANFNPDEHAPYAHL